MNDRIKTIWKQWWATMGIRHLGTPPEEYIPTPKDRCEYGFTHGYMHGHEAGIKEGKHEATEIAVALLYHQYQTLKTFHGKQDDRCLLIKNAILEIREAQARDMETNEDSRLPLW
jgi:hypothetical protein